MFRAALHSWFKSPLLHETEQIINIKQAYRDTNRISASARAANISLSASSSHSASTVTNSVPLGTESCFFEDLSVRLRSAMLSEKARKAETDLTDYQRNNSNPSKNTLLPSRYTQGDVPYSHTYSNSMPDKIEKSTVASTDRSAPTPGTNGIPQGPRAQTRHVVLVILDTPSLAASDKERDRPVSGGKALVTQAAKEKVQIEKRVTAFACSMWGSVTLYVTHSQRMRSNHPNIQGQGQGQGLESVTVVACELPFYIVRDLGSVIARISTSTPILSLHSNSISPAGTLFGTFLSSASAAPYKKYLKTVLAELSCMALSLQTVKSTASGLPSTGAAATSGLQTHTPSQQNLTKDVFLYSISDDKFDFISYSPTALARGV